MSIPGVSERVGLTKCHVVSTTIIMSLLTPSRPQDAERTSVVLPIVTCSTCAAPTALSSLRDHVCENHLVPRACPRPAQLSIPQSSPSQSQCRPLRQGPAPISIRPPFAGPSSAHPSPTDFTPPRRPSPHNRTPPSRSPNNNFLAGFSPQLRKNSPTNPFFPNSAGSFSSNASIESRQMPDTTGGGESGMAGVGRRAFAAAAWGVRAGVALAASARPQAAVQQAAVSSQLPSQSVSCQEPPQIQPESHHPYTAPLQPSAPTRTLTLTSSPQKSQVAMSQRSASDTQPIRKQSTSSTSSSIVGDSLAEMLTGTVKPSTKRDFFEKVKELDRSNSLMSRNTNSTTDLGDKKLASPIDTTFELDDDYENQPSALPWASPETDQMSRLHIDTKISPAVPRAHQRHPTASSEVSTNSSMSSKSGRYGGASGPESEEVVTPSQSFEGLLDRVDGTFKVDILQQIEEDESEGREVFESSLEKKCFVKEDRESRLPLSDSVSTTTSHIPAIAVPVISPAHNRSEHFNHRRTPSGNSSNYSQYSASAMKSTRRKKTCQKCGTIVGGSKRFVERDGVVLCEQDWKKLYLPSCRKCSLPIEKSAVSSSDGQLKGKWHRACFTCTKCDRPFEGDDFYVLGGKPWCQYHYHEEK